MATAPAIEHVFPGAILHPSRYFGYPFVGSTRRIKPTILGVVHTTETSSVPFPRYVVRDGKVVDAASWTFSVERDGTVHQFYDPVIAAPWTNGDLQRYDSTNPLIAAAAGSAYNFNEFCFLTIENVNRIFAGERLTDAQLDANRRIMQWGAELSGLPMDRRHVIGHYQVNGIDKVRCPTVPTDRDRVFGAVLATAAEENDPLTDFNRFKPLVSAVFRGGTIYKDPDRATGTYGNLEGPQRLFISVVPRAEKEKNGRSTLVEVMIDLKSGPETNYVPGYVGLDQMDFATLQPEGWSVPEESHQPALDAIGHAINDLVAAREALS